MQFFSLNFARFSDRALFPAEAPGRMIEGQALGERSEKGTPLSISNSELPALYKPRALHEYNPRALNTTEHLRSRERAKGKTGNERREAN